MRGSLGLHLTDQVPDPSTLSQNAQKLITHHPWEPFKEQIDANEPHGLWPLPSASRRLRGLQKHEPPEKPGVRQQPELLRALFLWEVGHGGDVWISAIADGEVTFCERPLGSISRRPARLAQRQLHHGSLPLASHTQGGSPVVLS